MEVDDCELQRLRPPPPVDDHGGLPLPPSLSLIVFTVLALGGGEGYAAQFLSHSLPPFGGHQHALPRNRPPIHRVVLRSVFSNLISISFSFLTLLPFASLSPDSGMKDVARGVVVCEIVARAIKNEINALLRDMMTKTQIAMDAK